MTKSDSDSKKSRMPQSFIAFESHPFRWLMGSHVTFFLSMQGQFLVRSLLAWDLTDSELALAYVNLAIAIPMVIGSLIGGAVIDRVERKRLVIISQIIALGAELTVLILYLLGSLAFWHLLTTSFILGMIFPFNMPTRIAMIYSMVGRSRLGNAMALQAAGVNLSRALGPAIMGLLVSLISIQAAMIGALCLYVFSILCMLKLEPSVPEQREKKPLLADIAYSFTYVSKHKDILLCLVFGLFPMLLVLPVFSLLVVFADDVWQTGESGLGMLMATLGIGGILGSLWVARFGDFINRGRTMIISAFIFAILLAGFSISQSFILALALLLLANVFSNISQTLNNTIIQLLAHDEVRGRMSSLVMISLGLTPLGVLPIAIASERYGISITVFSACILLALVVAAFFFFSPSLRNLDKGMKETPPREVKE